MFFLVFLEALKEQNKSDSATENLCGLLFLWDERDAYNNLAPATC